MIGRLFRTPGVLIQEIMQEIENHVARHPEDKDKFSWYYNNQFVPHIDAVDLFTRVCKLKNFAIGKCGTTLFHNGPQDIWSEELVRMQALALTRLEIPGLNTPSPLIPTVVLKKNNQLFVGHLARYHTNDGFTYKFETSADLENFEKYDISVPNPGDAIVGDLDLNTVQWIADAHDFLDEICCHEAT
jgi:hypothetical protein